MDVQTQAIRRLTREIPTNDFGFPIGIYRVDLLPWDDYVVNDECNGNPPPTPLLAPTYDDDFDPEWDDQIEGNESNESDESDGIVPQQIEVRGYRVAGFRQKDLHTAFVPLVYDEGFPAFENGLPFWDKLEFEPVEAYEAFKQYLHMSLGRVATNDSVDGEDYNGVEASGTRSITSLAMDKASDRNGEFHPIAQLYQDYFHTYYWGLRSRAYDMFRVAQHRKQQEMRALETQCDHYHLSRRLRHRLMQYMDSEEEFWDLMSPKVAMDMLKTTFQMERISAGLPANGPPSDSDNKGVTPMEILFKSIAQTSKSGEGKVIDESGAILDEALQDEATTEVIQQLIIRTGGH